MKNKEIISQLESLKENSRSFLDSKETDSIWKQDLDALEAAITIIKAYPSLERKVRKLEHRLRALENKKSGFCNRRVVKI